MKGTIMRTPLAEHLARPDAALPRTLEVERFRGHAGGLIRQHRAMTVEPHSRRSVLGNVVLAAAFLALWAVSLNGVTALWAAVMEFWRQVFGWSGYAVLLVDYPLGVSVPYLYVDAELPSRGLWWTGAILTCVLLIASLPLPKRMLPLAYLLRIAAFFQASAQVFFAFWAEHFPYTASGYVHGMLVASVVFLTLVPLILGLTYYILDFSLGKKAGLTALVMVHLIVFTPLQYVTHAYVLHYLSVLYLPALFFMFGLPLIVLIFIGFYGWGASWRSPAPGRDRTPRPGGVLQEES